MGGGGRTLESSAGQDIARSTANYRRSGGERERAESIGTLEPV